MKNPSLEILEQARKVRWVLLDVDGVLTDGKIFVFSDGTEGRGFHVRDGLGIRLGREAGLKFALLSGRTSKAVALRATELGFEEVHQGILDKATCFREMLERLDVAPEAVCYVGDDIVDVPVLRRAGLAVAPADADPEALEAAHWVTTPKGGEGAVREIVDLLLRAQGKWGSVTSRYLLEGR